MHYAWDKITAGDIWIYGLGRWGKQICELMPLINAPVKGILVSSKQDNPPRYLGIPVYEIEVAPLQHNGTVIITLRNSQERQKIEDQLHRKQTDCISWDKDVLTDFWKTFPHSLIDRRKHHNKALFVLCGYKDFLWPYTLKRLERYAPTDVDVCLLSSGLYDERLAAEAQENGWSYLYTKINSVTLIQNIAYAEFDSCEWIYKMDEDIFLTAGSLEGLFESYNRAEQAHHWHIGTMAPLIPLNEYGYQILLDRYGCRETFEANFGKTYFGGDGAVVNTPEIATYLWGAESTMPALDDMMRDARLYQELTVCGTRFNIGLILFRRSLWEDMNGFDTDGCKDMGRDEEKLLAWSMIFSKALLVTYSVVVGHFSFGPQEPRMRQLLMSNPELFEIRE